MGWTGAPTVFSATVTKRLHDILTNDLMELFVDDGGCEDDTFNGMMTKLRQGFQCCRDHKHQECYKGSNPSEASDLS